MSVPVERRQRVIVRSGGHSETGRIRPRNEDRFAVVDLTSGGGRASTARLGTAGVLMCVCDGMGGAAAGDVASQIAVDTISTHMARTPAQAAGDELACAIAEAIEAANAAILADAEANPDRRGMGTTATVAVIRDDQLMVGQIGDSRAYVLRNDHLVQITRDQNLANMMLDIGAITEREAASYPSNEIVQALGVVERPNVKLTRLQVRRGDRILVCSDGLSGFILDSVIEQVLATYPKVQEACNRLAELANNAGGRDNITVTLCELDGEGLAEPTEDEEVNCQPYSLPKGRKQRKPPPPVVQDVPATTHASEEETVTLPMRRRKVWPVMLIGLLFLGFAIWIWRSNVPETRRAPSAHADAPAKDVEPHHAKHRPKRPDAPLVPEEPPAAPPNEPRASTAPAPIQEEPRVRRKPKAAPRPRTRPQRTATPPAPEQLPSVAQEHTPPRPSTAPARPNRQRMSPSNPF